MKKVIAFLIALTVVMLCMWSALAATEHEVIGVYIGTESEMGMTATYTLELKANNRAELSVSASGYGETENVSADMDWYLSGDRVILSIDGNTVSGTYSGDRIILKGMSSGGSDLVLWRDTTKGANGSSVNIDESKEYRSGDYILSFEKKSGKKVAIVGIRGNGKNLIIPETIDGCTVDEIAAGALTWGSFSSVVLPDSLKIIGDEAFSYCLSLYSVEIPFGVEKIGDKAFYSCRSLKYADIRNGVKEIGNYTFDECISLESLEIPASVKKIGEYSFANCSKLGQITFTNGIEQIDNWAFSGCNNLGDFILPNSLKTIGCGAFAGCTYLDYFTIPASVQEIKGNPLIGCYWLHDVAVEDGNKKYKMVDDNLVTSDGKTLVACFSDEDSYIIPEGITTIGANAFQETRIHEITMPNSVKVIEAGAFSKCYSLKTITLSDNLEEIGDAAFTNCESLIEITLPANLKNIGLGAFAGCESLEEINIPEKVTEISDALFTACVSLKTVEIPESVNKIGIGAFADCYSLESVRIPSSVKEIGEQAFSECYDLKEVFILNEKMKLPDDIFDSCDGIEICCIERSEAEKYAKENNIKYRILSKNQNICTHDLADATCTEPSVCRFCGALNGAALGHILSEATCTEAGICERCGQAIGEPLGHEYFRKSSEYLPKCSRCGKQDYSDVTIGNIVTLGNVERYYGYVNYGEESSFEWTVLKIEGDKALLISRDSLRDNMIHSFMEDITWEDSWLRKLLNGDFYNEAFNAEEKALIETTKVTADKNPRYDTKPGNDTEDIVFLLSITEALTYFTNDEARIYETIYGETQYWWLRSPGSDNRSFAFVDKDGSIRYTGANCVHKLPVRPCIWIHLPGYIGNENNELTKQNEVHAVDKEEMKGWNTGDFVTYGTYPQNAPGTDETPIEWIVLEREGNKALLISKYALDAKYYNDAKSTAVTWENCTLRTWLNNEFFDTAFSTDEKLNIETTGVNADKKMEYNLDSGDDTGDKVFLLNTTEVEQYFADKESRFCGATDWAITRGVGVVKSNVVDGKFQSYWFLRSTSPDCSRVGVISYGGNIDYVTVSEYIEGVRPCVVVKLFDEVKNDDKQTNQDILYEEYAVCGMNWQKCDAGDIVTFGTYPQTEAGTDNTPIEWIVLARDGDKALVISRYALDAVPYNTVWTDVTWETCSLRTWLNNDFFNKAFSAEEKKNIVSSKVPADKNPSYSTNPGNATTDNVFLLSIPEGNNYFKDDASRTCAPTDYAVKNGAYTSSSNKVDGRASCWWWLRSPGSSCNYAANVLSDGSVFLLGDGVDLGRSCVRPCVWVRLF